MSRTAPVVVSSLVLTLAAGARADVLNVPARYATIQAAIDAASGGDEVVVAPGTYAEVIDFGGKAITVRGADGAGATTIDATGLAASAVTFDDGEADDSILEGFTIRGGTGTGGFSEGGAVRISSASPIVRDCVMTQNSAAIGGAVRVLFGSGTTRLERCTIVDNHATIAGGGGIDNTGASLLLLDCRVLGNAAGEAGGLRAAGEGLTTIVNCFFAGNEATGNFCCDGNGGGAINVQQGAHVQVINSTIVGNRATASSPSRGGGIHTVDDVSITEVVNSIVWGNLDNYGQPQISETIPGATTISFCCVEGGWSGNGSDVIALDPMFEDADGADDVFGTVDDDPRLATGSPCDDAGDDAAVPAGVTTDLLGNARFVSTVDLGAVERPGAGCPADLDGSGAIDFQDLILLLGSWGACADCPADLDDNGAVDFQDLLALFTIWGPCDG